MPRRRTQRGAATPEFAVIFVAILVPATLGLIMVAQAVWTWSGVVHLTRLGAVYAAAHSPADTNGSNVISYMQAHVPAMVDANQIITGPATITVQYWTQDPVGHQTIPFACAGGGLTADCVPDAVTVTVTGYQFNSIARAIGLQPIAMPSFTTSMQVESSGWDPTSQMFIP